MQKFKAFLALAFLIASAVIFSDFIEQVFENRGAEEGAEEAESTID